MLKQVHVSRWITALLVCFKSVTYLACCETCYHTSNHYTSTHYQPTHVCWTACKERAADRMHARVDFHALPVNYYLVMLKTTCMRYPQVLATTHRYL